MPFGTVGDQQPKPTLGANRTVAFRLAEGREHIPLLGYRWIDAIMRLEKANEWFRTHRFDDDPDRWTRNDRRRSELIGICVGCFLRAQFQVLDYAAACQEASPEEIGDHLTIWTVDPRDARALWLAMMPTPEDACAATQWAERTLGFWPRALGPYKTLPPDSIQID